MEAVRSKRIPRLALVVTACALAVAGCSSATNSAAPGADASVQRNAGSSTYRAYKIVDFKIPDFYDRSYQQTVDATAEVTDSYFAQDGCTWSCLVMMPTGSTDSSDECDITDLVVEGETAVKATDGVFRCGADILVELGTSGVIMVDGKAQTVGLTGTRNGNTMTLAGNAFLSMPSFPRMGRAPWKVSFTINLL